MESYKMDVITSMTVVTLMVVVLFLWQLHRLKSMLATIEIHRDAETETFIDDIYSNIQPLDSFQWGNAPVPLNATFKPKYHLTMGVEAGELSDLVAIDCTYAKGIQLRRDIIHQNPITALQCTDAAIPAASELYEWMFGTYLPKRFPSMFSIHSNSDECGGRQLRNTVTGESIPIAAPRSGRTALETLGEHIDADFIIMLPSSQAEDGSPIYHLQGFVNPCPAGFNLYERLGLPLSGVHGPVPGYKAKLERSMDRTFARLELGKLIRRRNWSIATNDRLFNLGGTHIFRSEHDLEREAKGETVSEQLRMEIQAQQAGVRIEDCRLRSERQSLFRLPKTGAVIFSFKTYLYTLAEIKASGQAEALADAIEGLGQGNVPEFRYYKREVLWGPKVLEYLRS